MRRALLAALVVGIAAPSIGVFLVQRRLALMGDGIGHVAFMGVAAGLFLGTSPVITGIVAASLAGAGIEVLREKGRAASDVALALIFYGGIAGGALLAFKSGQSNKVLGYLFGSVLTVNNEDLMILSVSGVVVLVTVLLWRLGGILGVGGVLVAFRLDTSPGATIVLLAIGVFFLAAILSQFMGRRRPATA